jgi:hypothetical protein
VKPRFSVTEWALAMMFPLWDVPFTFERVLGGRCRFRAAQPPVNSRENRSISRVYYGKSLTYRPQREIE